MLFLLKQIKKMDKEIKKEYLIGDLVLQNGVKGIKPRCILITCFKPKIGIKRPDNVGDVWICPNPYKKDIMDKWYRANELGMIEQVRYVHVASFFFNNVDNWRQ